MTKIKVKYKKGVDIMKFAKGLVIGGLLATGVLMMYSESDMLKKNKRKIMKKGKKVMRTLSNW